MVKWIHSKEEKMSENYEWNLKEIFPNKEELNQTKQI